MSSLPTFGYWDLRGFGEPVRYLLKYAGIAFNDKRYSDADQWFAKDKDSLGLDFPNLPYWIEGDFKISQSIAILRYLAEKHGLASKDPKTRARQGMVEQQIIDLMPPFFKLIGQEYEDKKEEYINKTLIPQLELLAKCLAQNDWFTAEFSYADILGYETLDWLRQFTPETFDKFPTLKQFLSRFENLPKIKEYRNSPTFKAWPLMGPWAKWGGMSADQ